MKVWKRVFQILICILLVPVVFFGCTAVYQLVMSGSDAGKLPVYGRKIPTDSGKMNVVVLGDKKETIVLLPGYGTPSPYLDFKSLAASLVRDYRVVIAEPFGYGLSGVTDVPRTVANMNQELHQCLEALGIDRYILAGHSIAGIYGLHYANTYPQEVAGYLGLDTSVAWQIHGPDIPGWLYPALKYSGLYRFANAVSPEALGLESLNEEENKQRGVIMQYNLANASIQEEGRRFKENLEAVQDMYFPEDIPVLFLLSSESTESDDYWLPEHEKLSGVVKKGETMILEGGHYIHYQNEERIAGIVKQFFGETSETGK